MEQVLKATGRMPPELTVPPLPEGAEHLWKWFCEVYAGNPLTYQELHSWSKLTGKDLTAFEAKLFQRLSLIPTKQNDG